MVNCIANLSDFYTVRGKLIENKSLSLLIISSRSLHNFRSFPWYANRRCTGHATMLTKCGNNRLNYSARTFFLTISTPITVPKLLRIPTNISLIQKKKPTQSATIDSHTMNPLCRRQTEVAVQRDSQQEGACTAISWSFPRLVNIVAWPVQTQFAYLGKFQKLCNDREE